MYLKYLYIIIFNNNYMRIAVVSHSYPTTKTIDFVFVDQLCREFANQGHLITVIAPQSITKCLFRGVPFSKQKSRITTEKGAIFNLYRPYWISFGNKFKWLFNKSFSNSVNRTLKSCNQKFDVIYGHFWAQAIAALPYATAKNIPLFAVAGEGELVTHKTMTKEQIDFVRETVKGCVCVATKSKNESIAAGFATNKMCQVFPNAINPQLFYQRDKRQMREKLNFSKEDFIVAFVGQWNSRKGVKRLSEALTSLHNPNIKAFFLGKGNEEPSYDHVIYQGTVQHDLLPEYLSSADVFVLPTNNEGCSNAVIEAMACGLPIISSDMEFNWDVLNESNSILVDPYDINAIAAAIQKLYENYELREDLQKGALSTAADLTIEKRATKILSFISSKINKQ